MVVGARCLFQDLRRRCLHVAVVLCITINSVVTLYRHAAHTGHWHNTQLKYPDTGLTSRYEERLATYNLLFWI